MQPKNLVPANKPYITRNYILLHITRSYTFNVILSLLLSLALSNIELLSAEMDKTIIKITERGIDEDTTLTT